MKSTLIEFFRFQDLESGILRKGDRYLVASGEAAISQQEMPIGQSRFNRSMRNLRYHGVSENEEKEALHSIQQVVTGLVPCEYLPKDNHIHQIDLVVNAAELAGLPFEAMATGAGEPLFLTDGGYVLTRRVRGAFAESRSEWPVRPRVLFIWSAAGGEVPVSQHREALLDALSPWIPPGRQSDVFVEVGNAKLRDIETLLETETEPFTHFHLLAHGYPVDGEEGKRFGIAFDSRIEGIDPVAPEALAKSLEPIKDCAVVMTIAACDSANNTNSITPEKSLAHQIHIAGVPVVVASQLPLTVDGSNILVRQFYRYLLTGLDVREALHKTRVELFHRQKEAGHDWLSVVGYVRLREGYVDFLKQLRLKSHLASMTNLRDRIDSMPEGSNQAEIKKIHNRLQEKIDVLTQLVSHADNSKVLNENRGLLGSAEKRLAEFIHCHCHYDGANQESLEALKRARCWYGDAFRENPSHHWTGVQFLALEAALSGSINKGDWSLAYHAAEVDRQRPGEYWALGSLAELALLAILVDTATEKTATEYLEEMKERVTALETKPEHDPFMSTAQQLLRYVNWWTPQNGFFSGIDLNMEEAAKKLVDLISERLSG